MGEIRKFDTGATRDTDMGKYDYEGFLSPLVLERFGEYMNKHRKQSDGSLRDSDNWQKGIPKTAYMKSAFRHFVDWWKEHRGLDTKDGIEEALCALMFNVMGYLHEYLKDRQEVRPWIEKGICNYMVKENHDNGICDLGYACDACPYNKETK